MSAGWATPSWDLPPLRAVPPAPRAAEEPVPNEKDEPPSDRPRKPVSARRAVRPSIPPAGSEWEVVHRWLTNELRRRPMLHTELDAYLKRKAGDSAPPQSEESCLRAFYRRAAGNPSETLALAKDFFLMERWRVDLVAACAHKGVQLVSRRDDPKAARKRLRAVADPALRAAAEELTRLPDKRRTLHRESFEFAEYVVGAAFTAIRDSLRDARERGPPAEGTGGDDGGGGSACDTRGGSVRAL